MLRKIIKSDNIRRLIFPDLALIGATSSSSGMRCLRGLVVQPAPALMRALILLGCSENALACLHEVTNASNALTIVDQSAGRGRPEAQTSGPCVACSPGFICYYNVHADFVASVLNQSNFEALLVIIYCGSHQIMFGRLLRAAICLLTGPNLYMQAG